MCVTCHSFSDEIGAGALCSTWAPTIINSGVPFGFLDFYALLHASSWMHRYKRWNSCSMLEVLSDIIKTIVQLGLSLATTFASPKEHVHWRSLQLYIYIYISVHVNIFFSYHFAQQVCAFDSVRARWLELCSSRVNRSICSMKLWFWADDTHPPNCIAQCTCIKVNLWLFNPWQQIC